MKIGGFLWITLWLALALALPASGYAQGNLVSLDTWTLQDVGGVWYGSDGTAYATAAPVVEIGSSNSAAFVFGSYFDPEYNPANCQTPYAILTGSVATVPGATYDISYTLAQNLRTSTALAGSVSFGTANLSYDWGALYGNNPSTIDWTAVATSTSTTISFAVVATDWNVNEQLGDFSVVQVPEVSTVRLLGLGGCVWFILQPWRRGVKPA